MEVFLAGSQFAREGEVFFNEFYPDAFACQGLHNPAQVIEVAGEPIHAVNDDSITTVP